MRILNILHNKLLLIMLLSLNNSLFAQTIPDIPVEPRTYMNSVTPMSADLATLGRYMMQTPSLSNGHVNQTIPLFDIKENGINYPVNLFYNFSGFRLKEDASSIGLGWGITEGSIIRIVKHVADENSLLMKKFEDFGEDMIEETGNGYVDPAHYCTPSYRYSQYSYTANRIFYRFYDAQPDIYIYSFGGYTGKFFWLNDQAIQLEHSDVTITRLSSLGDFIITTPDGNQYIFRASDTTENSPNEPTKMTVPPGNMPWYNPGETQYFTAWKLIEINNLNTKSKISFTYDYNYSIRDYGVDQISSVTLVQTLIPPGDVANYGPPEYMQNNHYFKTINRNSYLKEIESDNYKILFVTNSRIDGPEFRIEEIKVYSKQNLSVPVKTIKFDQEYFGDVTSPTKCWLKLKKLLVNDKEYEFSYASLPYTPTVGLDKDGSAIDHWGYFSLLSGGGVELTSLIRDRLAQYGTLIPNIQWGKRTADFESARLFALEKVQYPTKGYTKINYESSDGKGIRVASQEDFDGEKSVFRYYDYGGSGSYVDVPTYDYHDYFTYECCGVGNPKSYVTTFLSSHIDGDFFSDTENFYPEVTVFFGTPDGQSGKTVHKFFKYYSYGNKVVEIERTDYEYGNSNFIRKEETFYGAKNLKTIPFWRMPELNSTAIPGGICLADAGNRPSTGPVDPLLPTGFTYLLGNFNLYKNFNYAMWIRPDSTITTVNNIKTSKKFFYRDIELSSGLPRHSNVVRTEEKLSSGKVKSTEFYYLGDVDPDNNLNVLGIPKMEEYHLKSPVLKSKEYINDVLITTESNQYTYDVLNDHILRTNYSLFSTGSANSRKNWNLSYDSKANLITINRENDKLSCLFRGYNNTLPIVKSENVDYNTLSLAISTATSNLEQLLLNVGDLKEVSEKNLWRSFDSQLRDLLPASAEIITYTHKPLVGVTSKTDVKGNTTYYEYDDFQRLKNVKDQKGHIIKSYDYHYKSQTN